MNRFGLAIPFLAIILLGSANIVASAYADAIVIQKSDAPQTIKAIPYKFTLGNEDPEAFTVDNVSYKITIKANIRFSILSIDNGSFQSAFILSKDTVIFTTDKIYHRQKASGVVAILFDETIPENKRQLAFDISVYVDTINKDFSAKCPFCSKLYDFREVKQSRTIAIGPETTSYFEIITEIIAHPEKIFDLISKVYDKVVSCFNLSVVYDDPVIDSTPEYAIVTENCSQHPQLVKLSADAPPSVKAVFTSEFFDQKSSDIRNNRLFFIVPSNMTDGEYLFSVRGDVISNVFDKPYVVTSSNGSSIFVVKHENDKMIVVPEFGIASLWIFAVAVGASVYVMRQWRINRSN